MVYIIAMLVYFGVDEPHYTVYQGLTFSTMENCQIYLEKNKPDMSHSLWERHHETEADGEVYKLKSFLIDCVEDKPDPSWKEV